MKSNDPTVDQIVAMVVERLRKQGVTASPGAIERALAGGGAPAVRVKRRGVFDHVDTAVAAARRAYERYEQMPMETRRAVVRSMRQAALGVLEEMCQRAVKETSLGRIEDKRMKNRAAITKTPGPEILEPIAASGDDGLMITERAPYGVIAAITPAALPLHPPPTGRKRTCRPSSFARATASSSSGTPYSAHRLKVSPERWTK